MHGAGAANLPAHLKINLDASTILFVDDNALALDVMCSVFYGFGAKDRLMIGTSPDRISPPERLSFWPSLSRMVGGNS